MLRLLIFIVVGFFGLVIIWVAMSGGKTRKRVSPPKQELIACPDCGYLNRPKAKFCGQCGRRLN